MPHTKYQISTPSSFKGEKFFRWASFFLCSNLWSPGQAQFWPQGHHMNILGRGPLKDATYEISKLEGLQFGTRRLSKISFFISMWNPRPHNIGLISTPEPWFEVFWLRATGWCYMPNMKALALMVWDKKILKNFLLYLYVKSENPQHRTKFHSRAIIWSILVEHH